MKKVSAVITTVEGKKYPVMLLHFQHESIFITNILGEDMFTLETIVEQDYNRNLELAVEFLRTLGAVSDYKLIENDDITQAFLDKLRTKLL